MTGSAITPSPRQLRALAHPVRLRMLGLLRLEGPATSTTLAARLGLNTGATSYHLRQLAQHGFIEDDAERGTGRERWWRATSTSTVTRRPEPGDEEARRDNEAYLQVVATIYAEQLQRSVEELALLPEPWRDAVTYSDWVVRVGPRTAQRLRDAVAQVIAEADDEEVDADGHAAAPYVVQVNAYPLPGTVTEDPA